MRDRKGQHTHNNKKKSKNPHTVEIRQSPDERKAFYAGKPIISRNVPVVGFALPSLCPQQQYWPFAFFSVATFVCVCVSYEHAYLRTLLAKRLVNIHRHTLTSPCSVLAGVLRVELYWRV